MVSEKPVDIGYCFSYNDPKRQSMRIKLQLKRIRKMTQRMLKTFLKRQIEYIQKGPFDRIPKITSFAGRNGRLSTPHIVPLLGDKYVLHQM
jgi:hypothetical protein